MEAHRASQGTSMGAHKLKFKTLPQQELRSLFSASHWPNSNDLEFCCQIIGMSQDPGPKKCECTKQDACMAQEVPKAEIAKSHLPGQNLHLASRASFSAMCIGSTSCSSMKLQRCTSHVFQLQGLPSVQILVEWGYSHRKSSKVANMV